MKLRQYASALVFGAALIASGSASAWPDRPIELVVGFAPGGGTDLTARSLALFLEKQLGQTVTVINKPGASGAIGLAYVGRAKPDGYTLGMTNMPGLVSLPIEREPGFDLGSFTYLANLVRDPSAFSVKMDSPYKSMKDLVQAAGKEPEAISYGSTGVGTDDHLALVLFEQATGVQLNHVPFNGAAPLRNALFGGHTDVGGMNLGEAMPYSGKTARILGQASEERSPLAPDVPTFKEQGIDLVFASERGVVAPKAVPPEVVSRLREALKHVAEQPEFQKQMQQQFTEMDYLDGDAWLARLKVSDERFRKLWADKPWTE